MINKGFGLWNAIILKISATKEFWNVSQKLQKGLSAFNNLKLP